MAEIYNGDFPLKETLCFSCAYRMSRTLIPIDPEDYEITEEELKEIGLQEGEELILEQHICMMLYQDIDALVKFCTHYRDAHEVTLFKNNPYKL